MAMEVELRKAAQKADDDEDSEWKTVTFMGRRMSKGGWKTSPFIFGNEVCEKLGAIGLQVNLVSYLTQKLHLKSAEAANTVTNFGGTSSLTPLIGAVIADSYIGRYWVTLIGTLLYTLGSLILTAQAKFPSLRPASGEHATTGQMEVLYLAFLCLAAGSGGIRPCVAAFGADQFNEEDPKQRKQIRHFFNWYYFTIQASVLVTVTVFVYVQDNISWTLGFGIPAICMLLSIFTFVAGTPIYRMAKPTGSPLGRLVQVLVAAARKRRLETPQDPCDLYERSDKMDSTTRLLHTDQFRNLDKAAIVTEEDRRCMDAAGHRDPWRLCTVHQVEEFKLLIRMLPIWATSILVFTAWAQGGTFWIQQGRTMDRRLWGNFEIPPGSMVAFPTITLLLLVPIYDKLGIPLMRRLTGHPRGITFLQRIGVGLLIGICIMVTAGFTELKRRGAARDAGLLDDPKARIPISIFWLLPQYLLVGVMELFMSIGQLEFFYDQSPESMRSMATAIFWTVIAGGNYGSTILVSIVHRYSGQHGGWLNNNINRSRLEYFYWLIAGLLTINFCAFLASAKWYRYKRWNDEAADEYDRKGTTAAV